MQKLRSSDQDREGVQEVWVLAAIMVGFGSLGIVIGYLLDFRLGTSPWLLLAGGLLGFGTGLFLAVRYGLIFARE